MAKKVIIGIVFLHKRVKRWVVFNFHNLQWKLSKITLLQDFVFKFCWMCVRKKNKKL